MKLINTPLEGLLIIEPVVWRDERGYFFEAFSKKAYANLGINEDFVQDNQSCSNKGTLRGLHFQAPPFAQGKLVRVITGAVWDVAVDIRKNSPTYGQMFGLELNEENKLSLWIPPGFAHGFCTLEDKTIFAYKCTAFYNKDCDGGLSWNDPSLNVAWPKEMNYIISDKDRNLPVFEGFKSPF